MSQIIEDLMENKHVSNRRLLNHIIAVQLSKIERFNYDSDFAQNFQIEDAVSNLIELLKLRKE